MLSGLLTLMELPTENLNVVRKSYQKDSFSYETRTF